MGESPRGWQRDRPSRHDRTGRRHGRRRRGHRGRGRASHAPGDTPNPTTAGDPHVARRHRGAHRSGSCCSATRPRSASGVDRVTDTVGGRIAELLASEDRRVELSSVAVVGSRSADLGTQVARALLGPRPDVAVILVGANDATRLRRPAEAAHVAGRGGPSAARRRRRGGRRHLPRSGRGPGDRAAAAPDRRSRSVAGSRERRRPPCGPPAACRSTSRAITGPVFRADAGTLCHDGYHPSADGYRVWAHALMPAVLDAISVSDHL